MSQYPEASFIKSANALSQFVADDGAEVAVAGRSNAGKSSAINTLTYSKSGNEINIGRIGDTALVDSINAASPTPRSRSMPR